ncbi:MAG: winged helix-turn-helix transcriptional regulator [Candidatus Moraniibacteriota bacterium]|nr:MAG: winged helix-turn-helix transcriptional regulator [Candidatus Moranbacteria bacterium]
MYQGIFQELGLAKNEGRIYETLLREGELSVGKIAEKSHIHRRNVYDSMSRLVEKGLVFEILERRESSYQAVEPNKLMELVREKETKLAEILPDLESLYHGEPRRDAIFVYRGLEGWKNYMRDILRLGKSFDLLGARGALRDPKLGPLFKQFKKDMEKKEIRSRLLYHEEAARIPGVAGHFGASSTYKILPEQYAHLASAAILEDRVMIFSAVPGVERVAEETTITILINKDIADTFRMWFQFMWDKLPVTKVEKIKAS